MVAEPQEVDVATELVEMTSFGGNSFWFRIQPPIVALALIDAIALRIGLPPWRIRLFDESKELFGIELVETQNRARPIVFYVSDGFGPEKTLASGGMHTASIDTEGRISAWGTNLRYSRKKGLHMAGLWSQFLSIADNQGS